MTFDIYARNYFLTWPKCELHPDYVISFLTSLKHEVAWAIVAQETHEDGSFHLHAVCGFAKKTRIRDEEYFDLVYGDCVFHGNYQGCKSVKDAIAYCKKEDGIVSTFGTLPSTAKGGAYATALHSSATAEEFKSTLLELAPRDAVLYAGAIDAFATKHYGGTGAGFEPRRPLSEFAVPAPLKDWAMSNLDGVCFSYVRVRLAAVGLLPPPTPP